MTDTIPPAADPNWTADGEEATFIPIPGAPTSDDVPRGTSTTSTAVIAEAPVLATVDPDDVDDEETSAVVLLKSGRIRLELDGQRVVLRRPRLRELRRFRDALGDNAEEIARFGSTLTEAEAANAENPDLAAWEKQAATRHALVKIEDRQSELSLEWLNDVIDTLRVRGGIDVSLDGPWWLSSQQLANEMFDHWRTVPFGSGT